MEDWLIKEEHYEESMDQIVWPYLNQRKRELMLNVGDDNALFVCNYHADHADKMVVISHGFTETSHKYAEIIYYFLIHGYEVYIPDHCGHGKSYRMVEDPCLVYVDSYNRYIRDLLKVASLARREHKELPLTLYGHSMGGGIAGVAAGRKKEWFDHVILSSPMIQPQTGNIPWGMTKIIAGLFCLLGKEKDYVFGHGPYKGLEDFATSASMSEARFDYYQKYRFQEKTAQMSGAAFGWIRAAVKINHELLHKSYKNMPESLLLIQAESDQSVCNSAQNHFVDLVRKHRKADVSFIQIPGAKHEIFNAKDEVVDFYWKQIF